MILTAVAYLVMMAGLPVRRVGAFLVAVVLVWAVLAGREPGMWWTERGWAVLMAGWFVALTLRSPESGFFPRALGAIGGAAAVAAVLLGLQEDGWRMLDFQVDGRIRASVAPLNAMGAAMQEQGRVSPLMAQTLEQLPQLIELQVRLFPAMAALGSLAGISVAWWLYVRMAHGDDQGLLPLREFRFNDQLVWLFIGGLAMLLLAAEGPRRAGANAAMFMGALYALRGAGVVVFFGTGQSLVGAILLFVAVLFVAPLVVMGALVIGLGDTWLDLRARARAMTA